MKLQVKNVYVCLYTHKHGVDVGVYATHAAALGAAVELAQERVQDSWDDDEQIARLKLIEDLEQKLQYFHDVERGISYGETIEILERPLVG
jgi:hypothetical protein